MNNNLHKDRNSVILVIAPHPDDEVLGMGGTIARLVKENNEVNVFIATKGSEDLFSSELISTGRQEAKIANRKLGVKSLSFLDQFPAAKIDTVPSYQLNNKFREIIMDIKPDKIFIPHRGDIHKDHRAIHDSVLIASRPISKEYQPKEIISYEVLSSTEWGSIPFTPNYFVDISDFIKIKTDAMKLYKSQLKLVPHPRSLDSIISLARVRGGTINVKYAEAFMLIRSVYI